MFFPFLAAAIGATTFVQLGAMSVKIGFRTMALQAMSVAFLAAVLSAIAVTLNRDRSSQRQSIY